MLITVCQECAQEPLEHAGDTEGGVEWRLLLDEYESKDCKTAICVAAGTGFIEGVPWRAFDEFEVLHGTERCLQRTLVKA